MEEEELAQKVEDLNGGSAAVAEVPIVYAPLTNWQPQPMMKLKDFCHRIDKKPNFFEDLKTDIPPKIRKHKTKEEELDAEELDYLNKERWSYFDESYNSYIQVDKTISSQIKWENPFAIDTDLIFEHDRRIKEKR